MQTSVKWKYIYEYVIKITETSNSAFILGSFSFYYVNAKQERKTELYRKKELVKY